jgi:Kef-type K+ transport system membrane component KefB/mannitol/fructose-specific phosphotransferase system IIA component (Ntr-type)
MTTARRPHLMFGLLAAGIALLAAPALCLATETAGTHAAGSGPDMTHRMMVLMLQLGMILFAARLGGIVFERLRMPSVLGELFSGVIIGPGLLGAIPLPGFPHGLFHLEGSMAVGSFAVSPELYGICTLASVVLLFLVGLETDIKLLMRYSVVSSLVGCGGVILSFVLGNLATVLLSPLFFGEQLGFMDAPCILLGVISTATSVGITARVLSECKKLESPEGVTILASAVVDDVLGIILLAVGMGVINASSGGSINWGDIGLIAGKAFGVWIAATAIGLVCARRISKLLKTFQHRTVIAVMALGLAILLAGLFEEAGLAMIIGAYVMGLSLSGTDLTHVIQEKLHVLHVLLVPVFFSVMGMMVDIQTLASPKVLIFGCIFTLVGTVGKIVGCGVPAMCAGFNPRGALRIGVGMLPRGEVTLIIAGAAIAAGMLTPDLFGVVVFMTFAAALAAPPVLVATFKNPASGLRNPKPREEEQKLHFSFPSLEAADMLTRQLVTIFEDDGFFVHTLDRQRHIYQLLKDSVVIGFRRTASEIVFECEPAQRTFVNTAMLEVLTEFERTLNALRTPLDRTVVALNLQQHTTETATVNQMDLTRYLTPETLRPKLKATTREDAIRELVELLAETGAVSNVDDAVSDVLAREAIMSTGMQDGVAIPHARSHAANHLACAVGIHTEGIPFDTLDGAPARVIILTLSPRSKPAPHMQLMATLSGSLNPAGRAALIRCTTAEEMSRVLAGDPSAAPAKSESQTTAPAQVAPSASIASFFRKNLVVTGLTGTTKTEVLDELLDRLTSQVELADPAGIREALIERERQMSTGMENGVAIPHIRTTQVDTLTCVLGTHTAGMNFDSLDGQPGHIFVLTLSPEHAAAPHIQFMAAVCRFLDESGRKRVLDATDEAELWQALSPEA